MSEEVLLNNRYRIKEQLGKGGMAVVYRARDLMLERDVSIKVLREDYSSDPAFRERFRQEAKAAANLSHTNIVTIHDFGLDDNRLFIVMEYVPGKDLNSIIKERNRFKIDEGISLAVQACAGIGYAHRAGLVHCDVKPHNFLITPDNRLKVTDFGIARALASINPDEETDIVWGSPQYFSPEQAAGSAPSPSSDVYSLGIVMYQMFTGQLPFFAKTTKEFSRQHRTAKPIPPRELNPFISQELEEIILKVLSKEPSARYRTADQLGRVLMTFSAKSEDSSIESQAENDTGSGSKPLRNARLSQPSGTSAPSQAKDILEYGDSPNIDWLAVGLAILAMITSGGLIPYWIWVYFSINQPLR